MPWNPKDAQGHTKKASSGKARRQWADVANNALSRGLDEGSAVREANAAVAKRSKERGEK